MKVIVVGGGIMGLATAWALDREGVTVELFEQGALPNPLAASFDEHRLIRHPYGDHTGYARLIDPAFAAWDLMWRDLGQILYAPTGTLALSGKSAGWAERSAASLAAIGRPMSELSLDELPKRFPLIDSRGVARAFWIDTGGVLFAQDIVAALVRHLAQRPRVTLLANTRIRSVDLENGRATADDGTMHHGDLVVVASGAWAPRLLPSLQRRAMPSRQIVIYFQMPEADRVAWSTAPMVLDLSHEVGLYLVPPRAGRGLKVGDHEFSRCGDPDGPREATPEEMRPLIERCRQLLRGFDRWHADRPKVCFYTVTDDERFVVEKQGARGWAMSPCSGHGFKFGALMGLELARTIVSGRDPTAHASWAAAREGDTN